MDYQVIAFVLERRTAADFLELNIFGVSSRQSAQVSGLTILHLCPDEALDIFEVAVERHQLSA
jgi:hypothetical protein